MSCCRRARCTRITTHTTHKERVNKMLVIFNSYCCLRCDDMILLGGWMIAMGCMSIQLVGKRAHIVYADYCRVKFCSSRFISWYKKLQYVMQRTLQSHRFCIVQYECVCVCLLCTGHNERVNNKLQFARRQRNCIIRHNCACKLLVLL